MVESFSHVSPSLPTRGTGHAENKPIKSYVADICDQEQLVEYFEGVDVVFHCAAYVNFQYPPNMDELERNNVYGLCIFIGCCFIN